MKVILITLLLTFLSATLIFGQKKENPDKLTNVTFCSATKNNDTVKYADIVKCDEIISPYKNLKIKSFTLSVLIPSADVKAEGMYSDYSNTGSKLSKESLEILKLLETKKVKKLMIENVKVFESDGTTERKMNGIIINLK